MTYVLCSWSMSLCSEVHAESINIMRDSCLCSWCSWWCVHGYLCVFRWCSISTRGLWWRSMFWTISLGSWGALGNATPPSSGSCCTQHQVHSRRLIQSRPCGVLHGFAWSGCGLVWLISCLCLFVCLMTITCWYFQLPTTTSSVSKCETMCVPKW